MTMGVACSRQTGSIHADRGSPCQDYVAGFYDSSRALAVVALADGAGSYRYSAAGAKAAVEAVLAYFRVHSTITDRQAFVAMVSRAVEQEDPLNADVGTTLLFAAVTERGFVAGHIGDGVILMRQKGQFSVLSRPENGEHLWETYLLPCWEDSARFRFYEGREAEGFLLASDGIASQLYEESGRGCPACEKLYRWSIQMTGEDFHRTVEANFEGVFAKYSSDDKSLAVLWTEQ